MKKMKKILVLMLAMVMLLSLSITAFASGTEPPTTGTITVKNATKGYEYNAYKILDATYSTKTVDGETTVDGVSYTTKTPDLFKGEGSPWVVGTIADSNGNYNVQLASGKTAADVNTWIKNNLSSFTAIPPTTGVDANGLADAASVVWSGIPFGYYYITSGLGANVTVDTNTPDVELYDKNEVDPVDPVKTIVSVDGVAQNEVTEANAHVGSVVGFKVTAKTTNWINKDTIRDTWDFADKATNMEVIAASIVVKVNGAVINEGYTAAGDGHGGFTLSIKMTDDNGNSIYPANTLDKDNVVYGQIPIEITYNATITAAAATAPAKNEIPGDNPPPPVVVYTYAFQIEKTDGTDPLPGAEFELWSNKGVANAQAAALTFTDNGDGTYTYDPTGNGTTTLKVDTDICKISILGLDKSWTYTLKEITVPAGYNQAADVTVNGSSLTKVEEITTTGEGETTTTKVVDTAYTSTALYKETVVNNKGAELPSTGGIGTTIFYIVGGVMLLGAAVVLISKKRMHE